MAATRKGRRQTTPIDAYLGGLPEGQRLLLESLRAKIKSVLPDAEECISYRIPAFRIRGDVVAGFQATKKGGSYYPFSGNTLAALADQLRAVPQTKSALHFTADKPLPLALVRRLIKARLAEVEAAAPPSASSAKENVPRRSTRAQKPSR
jgi:uncharacterized protein YdhG (YjbR/CyaY superfamily)